MAVSAQTEQESFSFQAEVVQILDLMVHSLYSNKEIFLRELISNASDAIDRLRLELLSQSELPDADGPLQIRVSYDSEARTITVADNGIGMSRQEVIEHIGTIAKSGTREFLQALTGDQRKDASLIGQFGVGFYSAFIVADRVTLTTRREGLTAAEGVRWESDGRGEYTLETAEQPSRGTTVVLHLREGEDDLLNGFRLRTIIKKYSDHISLPILMPPEPAEGQRTPRRGGAGQPGVGAVGPAQERAHRAGLPGLLPARGRRLHRPAGLGAQQDRGDVRVHAAAVRPVPRALRPVDAAGRPGRQAAHQAGLRAGGLRPADAAVPAVHPRRDRLERPAAQRLPRTAAGQPRRRQHPVQRDQEGAAAARRHRGEGAGEVRRVLEGVRRRPQGGPGRGLREPGRDRQAAALHLHQVRLGRAGRLAWPTT